MPVWWLWLATRTSDTVYYAHPPRPLRLRSVWHGTLCVWGWMQVAVGVADKSEMESQPDQTHITWQWTLLLQATRHVGLRSLLVGRCGFKLPCVNWQASLLRIVFQYTAIDSKLTMFAMGTGEFYLHNWSNLQLNVGIVTGIRDALVGWWSLSLLFPRSNMQSNVQRMENADSMGK